MNRLSQYFSGMGLENAPSQHQNLEVNGNSIAHLQLGAEQATNHAENFLNNEVMAAGEDADKLVDVATGLEALALDVAASKPNGGLSRDGGALLNTATANLMSQAGLKASIVPSVESFGGASERSRATNVSVESLSDTAKRVWEAIKRAVLDFVNGIVAWVTKFIVGSDKVKETAEAAKKKISEASELKEITIDNLAAIHISGKFAGFKETTASIKDHVVGYVDSSDLDKVVGEHEKQLGELVEATAKKDADAAIKATVDAVGSKVASEVAGELKVSSRLTETPNDDRYKSEDNVYMGSKEIAGGKQYVAVQRNELKDFDEVVAAGKQAAEGGKIKEALSKVRMALVAYISIPTFKFANYSNDKVTLDKDVKVTPAKADVETALDDVIEMCDAVSKMPEHKKKVKEKIDGLIKKYEAAAKDADEDNEALFSSLAKGINNLGRASDYAQAPLSTHAMKVSKAIVALADKAA